MIYDVSDKNSHSFLNCAIYNQIYDQKHKLIESPDFIPFLLKRISDFIPFSANPTSDFIPF